MLTPVGKRFAQIQDGRCLWKFDSTTLPEFKEGSFQFVEITTPEPDEGDLFNGTTFYKPAPLPGLTPTEREVEGRQRMSREPMVLAVILWAAQRFGITPAQARDEIIAIYRNLT
jgi:hypothetical protein